MINAKSDIHYLMIHSFSSAWHRFSQCARYKIIEIYLKLSNVLQSEMKMYGCDTVALKQHFGKKLMELEEEKRAVQVFQIVLPTT